MTNATTVWTWKQEPALMARLLAAQNSDKNINRDIMTFAGFCASREQLEQHVLRCER